MTEEEARRIAQDFLDQQGDMTMSGNVDGLMDFCAIPCSMESGEGRAVATTEAEMRAICSDFINRLRAKQVTHMVRRCLEALFKDGDTIWATYETRYVAKGNVFPEAPYGAFAVLRRVNDRWRFKTLQFAVSSGSPVNVTLRDWAQRQERELAELEKLAAKA
ncbi:hypothetical protein [Litoreibacter albidus]|uniref:SnoaL-like domain-containing protein n=1 Tax=Litoreibacter albidus TaxID=670155 RepID=A0A1H2XLA7_9RHOB|nr:hypothetical protein [Litoreibacter albidus]SDW93607.1 hypothetical protein SAMN04488001_2032 [Litoreibacter albidus]